VTDSVIRQLIDRARSGDTAALGELLDQHRDRLVAVARQQLAGRAGARLDASDVVQQTCLSVHRKIAEFDGADAAQFAAWLARIHEHNIANAMRDQFQAQKRAVHREVQLPEGSDLRADQSSPSGRAIRAEEAARLARAMELLAEDERLVLRMRYEEGRKLAEICEATGLTKDALVWMMKRAMSKLRPHLRRSSE